MKLRQCLGGGSTARAPKNEAVIPASYSAEAGGRIRHERNFWLGQFFAGLAGYLGIILVVAGYAMLTPYRAHRGGILLLVAVAFVVALISFVLRHRVVASRHRVSMFSTSSVVAFLLLAGMCWLDGGIDSPITYLLITAMSYLTIDYPLSAILICGSAGLASYTAVAYASARPLSVFETMIQVVALTDIWTLAIICSVFRDRKNRELRRLRLELESRATTDSLTGCLNHRAFTQALDHEAARCGRTRDIASILLIDIDHFKAVNDCHGHTVGDEVLRAVGAVLRKAAREVDSVGRPGGDELAWLAPGTDEAGAFALAGRLRILVAGLELPVAVTLSVGIFSGAADPGDGAALFRRADEALYRAKQNGRDQVVAFSQADTPDNAARNEEGGIADEPGGSVATAELPRPVIEA